MTMRVGNGWKFKDAAGKERRAGEIIKAADLGKGEKERLTSLGALIDDDTEATKNERSSGSEKSVSGGKAKSKKPKNTKSGVAARMAAEIGGDGTNGGENA